MCENKIIVFTNHLLLGMEKQEKDLNFKNPEKKERGRAREGEHEGLCPYSG